MGCAEGHFTDIAKSFSCSFLMDFHVLAAQGTAKSYMLFSLLC